MRKLDIYSTSGGTTGGRTRLRNQMDRLFNASVSLIYEDAHSKQFISSHIADRGEFWWNPRRPDERMLWESKIRLGEDFFKEIIRHSVPLDMNILKALKRSSLGLDWYLWLDLPHLLAEASAAALLATVVPPVRGGPVQGRRQIHSS